MTYTEIIKKRRATVYSKAIKRYITEIIADEPDIKEIHLHRGLIPIILGLPKDTVIGEHFTIYSKKVIFH